MCHKTLQHLSLCDLEKKIGNKGRKLCKTIYMYEQFWFAVSPLVNTATTQKKYPGWVQNLSILY
jgi:hypothetical protein